MKKIIFILLFPVIALLSCSHFADERSVSVWSDGVWILPLLTTIGAIIFFYRTFRASKSNSDQQVWENGQPITKHNTGNVKPGHEGNKGNLIFAIGFTLATIVIILVQNLER